MTTTNTHIVNFDQPIERVYEAFTDAGFWEEVANRFSVADDKVEGFDTTDAGATVAIRYAVSADKISTQAQRFAKSRAGMTRMLVISPPNDDGATSTVTTEASGVPASFSVSQKLTAQGEGSMLTTSSEFAINVPLLGGKLEEKAVPCLECVLNAETIVLVDYAAKQVCAAVALPGRH